MVSVVESQLQILGDLVEILRHPSDQLPGDLAPHRNAVKIPFMIGKEQMALTRQTIKQVVDERKIFRRDLDIWLKEMRHSQTSVLPIFSPPLTHIMSHCDL